MNNYISADEFKAYWIEFINQEVMNDPQWAEWYDHDYKKWTEITIGLPTLKGNSPIGEFIKSKTGLRYRKEDGLVDLAFAPDNNFEGILSLHEKQEERIDVLKKDPEKVPFYPRYYSILLEHENDIYRCFEEMAKLCYCRARLKVLITYNENIDSKSDYKFMEELIVQNFRKIKLQSNKDYNENEKTEYLLLIGQKDQEELKWFSYIYDFKSR